MTDINREGQEALIEKARLAYVEAWEAERNRIGRGIAAPGTKSRAGIEAAFAVFEQAHTSTDDEREALVKEARDEAEATKNSYYTNAPLLFRLADALAGFRRPVQGEPSAKCPQPCEHLSQHDAREGRTCPEHPCTCTDREEGTE